MINLIWELEVLVTSVSMQRWVIENWTVQSEVWGQDPVTQRKLRVKDIVINKDYELKKNPILVSTKKQEKRGNHIKHLLCAVETTGKVTNFSHEASNLVSEINRSHETMGKQDKI